MANFFEPQTLIVNIDEENWVKLKKLTFGEVQEISAKFSKFNPKTGQVESSDITAAGSEIIYKSVVEWGGPGFDNRPANPENVAALPPKIVAQFAEAASKLNSDISDEEGKA